MINELDDRLSNVKRWGILRTINTQSVAEHVFNVVRICEIIAPWFGIVESSHVLALLRGALHHDDFEAITGDIPATAKPFVNKTEKGVDAASASCYTDLDVSLKDIIKLADLLEAYHFLCLETRMGNRYVIRHRQSLKHQITQHINSHPIWPMHVNLNCHNWMVAIEVETSQTFK